MLLPWRWRQQVHLKSWQRCTRLHWITSSQSLQIELGISHPPKLTCSWFVCKCNLSCDNLGRRISCSPYMNRCRCRCRCKCSSNNRSSNRGYCLLTWTSLILTPRQCLSLLRAAVWMEQQAPCHLLPAWVGAGTLLELLQHQQTLPASLHCRSESKFYNRGWAAVSLYRSQP